MCKKFVLKCKGRGYLVGTKRKSVHVNLTQEEVDEKNKREESWNKQRLQWNPSLILRVWTIEDTKQVRKRFLSFKRNLSDVPEKFIFSSKDEVDKRIEELKTNPYYGFYNSEDVVNLELLEDCEIEEYDYKKVEKRVLHSKKQHYYTNNLIKLKVAGDVGQPQYCNHCGTLIYNDESILRSYPNTIVCIHCLVGLAKDIEEAYANLPEKYKEDWLLAKSLEM